MAGEGAGANDEWRFTGRVAAMMNRTISLRTLVLSLSMGIGGMAFFTGIYVARAMPGGPSKPALSFAGTLRKDGQPMGGNHTLGFTFKKGGSPVPGCAPTVKGVSPDSTGGKSGGVRIVYYFYN
jgi:hypothetical protein